MFFSRVTVSKNSDGTIADGTGGGTIRGAVIDSTVGGNTSNGITVSGSANYGLVATGGTGMLVRRP